MQEYWKDIPNYETLYAISNYGNVKNVQTAKILKPSKNKRGYLIVRLSKNRKIKSFYVHRLVAEKFINKKNANCQVNHIDGNKLNNFFLNLEWCSCSENMKHAYINKLTFGKMIPVGQYDLTGKFIKKWKSQSLAANALNIKQSCISECCRDKRKTAGGYIWKNCK